jgi:alpha-amylase
MLVQKCMAAISALVLFTSCGNNANTNTTTADTATVDNHVAWINQGNIYEVNVRQYTPEGTFAAFAKHLDRLKEMGVQTLWFMPINPISKVDRKGKLGSYYAISNYTNVNPEFGNLADFKNLVQQCHEKGLKVIIDWVPNHTGADHYWLEKNPDFYVIDSATKKAKFAFDWSDTRDLNYDNKTMQDSMIASMEFWLNEAKIDGFRCDVAGEVPTSFWERCIPQLRKGRNILMLAEGDKPELIKAGFDITYAWPQFAALKRLANGQTNATIIDSFLAKIDTSFAKNALHLYFTSNHDENSWNKADYATMPGAVHAPFAVLTQTIKQSTPLIYSGQEEPFLDSISFFYKDTITFSKYARANFYKKLLTTRSNNIALASNASFTKLISNNDKQVYAFVREQNGKKVLVVLNFSNAAITATLDNNLIAGKAKELFSEKEEVLQAKQSIALQPWDYKVFVY